MRLRAPTPASALSLGAMIAVLIVGIGYMGFGVLKLDPFERYTVAKLLLRSTGGLGDHSPVLLTGVRVGKVTALRETDSGVLAELRLDSEYEIPQSSAVHIENLSALGEPYLEFAPRDRTGPYIRDGQLLDTRAALVPMSIPQVSARVVELLGQFDPRAVSSLVATLDEALSGTEADIPRLERATTLLAETILSRTETIHDMLIDLQNIGGNMDRVGPGLAAAGNELGKFGGRIDNILNVAGALFEKRDTSAYLADTGLVPLLGRTREFLTRTGPGLSELAPVLTSLSASVTRAGGDFDISALIAQAVGTVGDDGALHLQLNLK